MASNTHLFYLEINKIKITFKKSLSPSLYHDFFAVIKRCFKTLEIQHAIKLLILNFYSNYNRLAWQKNLNTLENKIKLYGSMMLNFIYGRKQANFRQKLHYFFLEF